MKIRRNLALLPRRSLSSSGEASLAGSARDVAGGGALQLADCRAGQTLEVLSLAAKLNCAQRLRELGIVEGAQITLLRRSDPFVVLALDSRIAIDVSAAQCIKVRTRERLSGQLL
jgi:Fe2+ transport system protein FeoA